MQPWKSLVGFLLGSGTSAYFCGAQIPQHKLELERNFHQGVRVPVTLAVMSACPDAIICESVFDEVIGRLGHFKVAIGLTYIGRFAPAPSALECAASHSIEYHNSINASETTYGVTCKHGVLECAGNIQQLCTAQRFPSPVWWPFVQCMNDHDRSEIGTDAVAEACSLAVGHKYDGHEGVARCARGEEGVALLKKSIENTKELNVTSVLFFDMCCRICAQVI